MRLPAAALVAGVAIAWGDGWTAGEVVCVTLVGGLCDVLAATASAWVGARTEGAWAYRRALAEALLRREEVEHDGDG